MSRTDVSIFDLSPAEKLQLVEDLWDDLAADPGNVPIPEGQLEELDRRKKNLMGHSTTAMNWEDVKQRVRDHHGH